MAKTAENVANVPAEKPKLTAERAIAEIRSLRAGGLFVGNMEYVDKLLAEYDALLVTARSLANTIEVQDRLITGQQEEITALTKSIQTAVTNMVEARNEPSIVQEGVPS